MNNQNKDKVILTGIKPTGAPHLGNYCGAIKPMIETTNAKQDNETIYCFIADVHALNGGLDAKHIREFTYSLIATYLACGIDPDKVIMFRQSAVRQHAELGTLLTNVTSKGLMQRAHSYKANVDNNIEKELQDSFYDIKLRLNKMSECLDNIKKAKEKIDNLNQSILLSKRDDLNLSEKEKKDFETIEYRKLLDEKINNEELFIEIQQYNIGILRNGLFMKRDQGINMGLYTYPILMAADILLYQSNIVPVGKDQVQHIEMTRDIASVFNNKYSETFVLPEYEAKEDMPEISGLDGRKMSKSYGNHIPIFCEENELKSLVKKIITDSAKPEEPKKDVEDITLVQLYRLFATEEQTQDFINRLAKGGFGYGDAKMELFEVINKELAPKREEYKRLMANRKELDAILEANEEKARRVAEKTIRKVKKKMGLVPVA